MTSTPYRFLNEQDESEEKLLKVFCRLKPLVGGNESCFSLLGNDKLITTPSSPTMGSNKQLQFTFQRVFPEDTTQKQIFDTVAFPLVQKVLLGQSSLLFAYGNTGSGKTFTMKGSLNEGGVMPRCLDVIFNSISPRLAKPHVFKSDKFNSYLIQTEDKAQSDLNSAMASKISHAKPTRPKLGKKQNSDPDLLERFIDPTQILMINNKNSFAVFIHFIEIYNNAVYDLLDDSFETHPHKQPQSKMVREDSKKNMFVHGVTEVEVSSTEEAFEIFYKGFKRRKIAETLLNTHSSRSHSIFNIRVVQADLSQLKSGKVSRSNIPILMGQLSLVDLAGSERSSRTHNVGKQLVEAGNINNSLMTLRLCFDAIKENKRGNAKVVPYRDSKLTMLFKNLFEGDNYISMIVCINPRRDDYDETLQVLKFSESSQEILISTSLTKQHEMEELKRKLQLDSQSKHLEDELNRLLESFDDVQSKAREPISLPEVDFSNPRVAFAQMKANLATVQNSIKSVRESSVTGDFVKRVFTNVICDLKEAKISSYENDLLKQSLREEKGKAYTLESEFTSLKRKMEECQRNNKKLKKELLEKDKTLLKMMAEKDRDKEKMVQQKNVYKEKFNCKLEKFKQQRTQLEMEVLNREDRLARVGRVLSDELISTGSTPSVASCRAKFEKIATPLSVASTPRLPQSEHRPTARKVNIAVSNRRHRRSRSTGDVWVEHKPAMPVPLSTVMQPSLPKRRSITKLTDAKQVTQGASKYCLMTQTQDSDGDLETRLYKGDVIPTCGGGAQVMFNDIEVLKQVSPDSSPKQRPPKEEPMEQQPSCSYDVRAHMLRPRRHK